MLFIPTQKTGLGNIYNIGAFDFGFDKIDFSNTDFSNTDFSDLLNEEKRQEREIEAIQANNTILTQNSDDRKRLSNAQYNTLLQLAERIKSTGTDFEKDFYLPDYLEQLECYKKGGDISVINACTIEVRRKHALIRRAEINASGLKHESEYSKIYNEKAAEQNAKNKKMLIIGSIILGAAIIGGGIYYTNK